MSRHTFSYRGQRYVLAAAPLNMPQVLRLLEELAQQHAELLQYHGADSAAIPGGRQVTAHFLVQGRGDHLIAAVTAVAQALVARLHQEGAAEAQWTITTNDYGQLYVNVTFAAHDPAERVPGDSLAVVQQHATTLLHSLAALQTELTNCRKNAPWLPGRLKLVEKAVQQLTQFMGVRLLEEALQHWSDRHSTTPEHVRYKGRLYVRATQ